jgi:hypothetical protein
LPLEGGIRSALLRRCDLAVAPGPADLAFGGRPPGNLTIWVVVGLGLGDGGQAGQFIAASVAASTRARVRLDMVASDRLGGAVWASGWLLGGDGWPPSQLPPATGRPGATPATRWASAEPQPRMGGLRSSFGDALLGQDLAQPGMLVVHVPSPSYSSALLAVAG